MSDGDPAGPDAVVVGAGIVGISAAHNLLRKGFRVRLMDPEEPGQGTSYGNAGVISPWSSVPQSTSSRPVAAASAGPVAPIA